jgi:cytoskeletal protein RodZ
MKTVGETLRETRLERGITISEVEHGTKIRAKFLEAIEADDFVKLPSLSYAKGFVKNYSDFLGLNSEKTLAFFRRQTNEMPKSSLLPKGMGEPLNRTWWQLTPGRFVALIIIGLVTLFLFYLGFQYRALQQSPKLIIDTPVNHTVVSESRLEILGSTDPDATVTINGISVLVRSDGKFFDQVVLVPGVNTFTIVATSRLGKTTTVTRDVGLKLLE